MDIQKEEDDFNAWFNKQTINAVPDADLRLQRLWASLAWQAAKAQAVPEGFVLVPIHTLEECLNWAHVAKWDSPSKEVENEIEHHELIIGSIIEAQQPSSTSDCPDEP